jgi:hypothetical protein
MFRQTMTIAGAFLGMWLIGVMALALVPPAPDAGRNARTPISLVNMSVWSAYQDPTGKFTIHVRTPPRYERSTDSVVRL